MAKEIRAVTWPFDAHYYVLVRNPANQSQAWDTQASDWAAYDKDDPDQQVRLGGGAFQFARGKFWQFADLPAGLSAGVYPCDAYTSWGEFLGVWLSSAGLTHTIDRTDTITQLTGMTVVLTNDLPSTVNAYAGAIALIGSYPTRARRIVASGADEDKTLVLDQPVPASVVGEELNVYVRQPGGESPIEFDATLADHRDIASARELGPVSVRNGVTLLGYAPPWPE